jgi:hypothetical protein
VQFVDGIIIEREDQAVRSVAITQPIHNSCKYLTQQESGHNYFHLGEPEHVAQRWAVQGCDVPVLLLSYRRGDTR